MAAIAAELSPDVEDASAPAEVLLNDDTPEIEMGRGNAGRETLAAISHEMLRDVSTPGEASAKKAEAEKGSVRPSTPEITTADSFDRDRRPTVSYEERPLSPPSPPLLSPGRPASNRIDAGSASCPKSAKFGLI